MALLSLSFPLVRCAVLQGTQAVISMFNDEFKDGVMLCIVPGKVCKWTGRALTRGRERS